MKTYYTIEETRGCETGVNEHTIEYWKENGVEIDNVSGCTTIETFDTKEEALEKIKSYISEVWVTKTMRNAEANITIYSVFQIDVDDDDAIEETTVIWICDAPTVRIIGNAIEEDIIIQHNA